MKVTKVYVNKAGDDSKSLKAYVDITLDDELVIRGAKIMHSTKNNSYFLAMPSQSYKDKDGTTKYKDIVFPLSKELRTHMTDVALTMFNKTDNTTPTDNEPDGLPF